MCQKRTFGAQRQRRCIPRLGMDVRIMVIEPIKKVAKPEPGRGAPQRPRERVGAAGRTDRRGSEPL